MPIVYEDFQQGEARQSSAFPSTRHDVLEETFAQAFEENPIQAYRRISQLWEDERTGSRLDASTARARLADAGLENELKVSDAGITEAGLETLMERKRTELRRRDVFSRAQGGLAEGAQRLGIVFATSLVDPIGAGVNFVPVVGEARYGALLARASTIGRIGVRAGVGAAEGIAGAALVEPLTYTMRSSEQADYSMADSLLNVALGGVVGAGLHVTVGTTGEGIESILARRSLIPRAVGLSAPDRLVESRLAKKVEGNLDGAIADYGKIVGTDGGRLLNTDLARELSPEYRADRTRSAAVHEPASYLVKQIYERKLAEAPEADEDPLVVFSAGGTGAGKTTGLDLLADVDPTIKRAQIIYDTNMNTLASAAAKVDQALAAGKEVQIVYTWRDPVDALNKGALPRAMRMGRTVPINEHAKTHVGAVSTIKALQERYANDPRVRIQVIDNSHGRGRARLGNVEQLPGLEYTRVRDDLLANLEAERRAGRISEAVYRGTLGGEQPPGAVRPNRAVDRREPQPQDRGQGLNPLLPTAAERADLATPEVREAALRAAVGQAVTGDPINVDPILSARDSAEALRMAEEGFESAASRSAQDLANVQKSAEETLAREPAKADPVTLAEDEASLAIADAKALSDQLGVEPRDAEMAEVEEAVKRSERWARAAELATVCLVRGG